VAYKTKEGDTYYFNTETLDGSWDEPDNFNPDSAQLTKEELQVSNQHILFQELKSFLQRKYASYSIFVIRLSKKDVTCKSRNNVLQNDRKHY